jgi:hypothetical protein
MAQKSKEIRNILIESPSGVHTVFYGKKIVSGKLTDQDAIVHVVEHKIPKNEIKEEDIIPESITIGKDIYYTDVIQIKKFKLNLCNPLDSSSISGLNSFVRPISGGIEICPLSSFYGNKNDAYVHYSVGTLGGIVVDNTDGTLVGITNGHVAVDDQILVSDRDPSKKLSTIFDINNLYLNSNFYSGLAPGVIQWGSHNGLSASTFSKRIGITKRYQPLTTGTGSNYIVNTIDCALIALNTGVVDSTSAQQAFLTGTYAMPFATSGEISSIVSSNIPLYAVGRTTGPKGSLCPMSGLFSNGSSWISYSTQDGSVDCLLSDCIYYTFRDLSTGASMHGDSGSIMIGDFTGVYKIVGLNFAAGTGVSITKPDNTTVITDVGLFCRIDNIARQMNVSPWSGNTFNYSNVDPTKISKLYRPITDNRTSITISGKTYYQVGATTGDSSLIVNA